jgi:hypothetical protein
VKSCVTTELSLPSPVDEAKNLYLHHSRHAEKNLIEVIDQARRAGVQLEMLPGGPISDLKLHDARPARQLTPMSYLGRNNNNNDVTGVDRDCRRMAIAVGEDR